MELNREQEIVLGAIVALGNGDSTSEVTISAIHGTFSNMDVRDLFNCLEQLLKAGLIRNARETTERFGNSFVITPEGSHYHHQIIKKHP